MNTATLVIGNYNYSSWSLRAWLMTSWSGLAFETLRLPLDTSEFASAIGPWSPTGKVPVLHCDGLIIWESLAIGEYLAERFPERALWPLDQADRARARSLAAEMHSGFATLRNSMPMNCRAHGRQVPRTQALDADISRIQALWGEALAASGGPCLFGAPGIVDAMYAPVVFRFATYDVSLSDELSGYSEQMRSLPAMREWLSHACAEPEVIENEEVGRPEAGTHRG